MPETPPFVDIHCHLVPGIDDGAKDWDDTLAMARMAVADGIGTIVATPHQLGGFSCNDGATIRARALEVQAFLAKHEVPLRVLAGGDVRIEPDLTQRVMRGEVMSLADHRRHVLLELPHELYFPLEGLLKELAEAGIVGVLSHPERNQGILSQSAVLAPLVRAGCLMQVTAGSFLGAFGGAIQKFSEWMLSEGLVHFVSTDAHGVKARRPLLRQAFERVAALAGEETALDLFCRHGAAVVAGEQITLRRAAPAKPRGGVASWLGLRRTG